MEVVVGGQHLLGLFDPGQEGVTVGGHQALPDVAHGLTLQARGVGEQLAQRHLRVSGSTQVVTQGVVEGQPSFIAQRHDDQSREGLGDRPDHELGVVVGSGRPLAQTGGAHVGRPDEVTVSHDAGADPG